MKIVKYQPRAKQGLIRLVRASGRHLLRALAQWRWGPSRGRRQPWTAPPRCIWSSLFDAKIAVIKPRLIPPRWPRDTVPTQPCRIGASAWCARNAAAATWALSWAGRSV